MDHTLDKVRGDINRLTTARNALWQQGTYCQPFLVLKRDPTPAMNALAESAHVTIAKVDSFAALFLEFERYRIARLKYAFGSAVNPVDGTPDQARYVPVSYYSKKDGRNYSVQSICDLLRKGKNVVLLGEYGSGKSRCIRQCFEILSAEWGSSFEFPFAINLRESWGLRRADEILRRHMDVLGLDELKSQVARAYNGRDTILFLDGFDEIGIQAWDTDEDKLVQIRATALQGIRELTEYSKYGVLVAGREHYFASYEEMLLALGCKDKETEILYAKEEFTEDEMRQYFLETDLDVTLPSWLPRRPLICQTIAQLSENEVDRMFGNGADEAKFWEHFVSVLCERDARIHPSFSAEIIKSILLELSRRTRMQPANVGPITQKDLQDAFEFVVGQRPVEEASALLQRLPTLGRVASETPDLQFVDVYILDGLRGTDIGKISERGEADRARVVKMKWTNPLGALGQAVLLPFIESRWSYFQNLAEDCSNDQNRTLAADVVSSMLRSSRLEVDFGNLSVTGGSFGELDFSTVASRNLQIQDSTVEELVVPVSPPIDVLLKNCVVGKITGVSSLAGLPRWIVEVQADEFDSVRTISRIRNAGLSPAHEALVGIVKKTFFQPGSGRKEEALTRGFAEGPGKNVAPKLLKLLVREGILGTFKGNDGIVYKPMRAHAGRMSQMLEQLRSSNDPIWLEAAKIS